MAFCHNILYKNDSHWLLLFPGTVSDKNPLHTHHTALRPQQSDYFAKLKAHVHHCSQSVPSCL